MQPELPHFCTFKAVPYCQIPTTNLNIYEGCSKLSKQQATWNLGLTIATFTSTTIANYTVCRAKVWLQWLLPADEHVHHEMTRIMSLPQEAHVGIWTSAMV
jgi:hypothetical protein